MTVPQLYPCVNYPHLAEQAPTCEHRHNLREMALAYGRLVYPPIPQATTVAESTAYQEPLWMYAPRHPATAAYKCVLERMLSDVQE